MGNPPSVTLEAKDIDIKEMLKSDAFGVYWGARVGFMAAGANAVGLAGGVGASAVNIIGQNFWW